MKKLVIFLITIFLYLLFQSYILVFHSVAKQNEAEKYELKKITLGYFKYENNKYSGTHSIPWWKLEPSHLTADENNNIYLLDIFNKRVHIFDENGRHLKEVILAGANFPYNDRNSNEDDSYIEYRIQVSANGNYFYIGAYTENWTIYDNNGLQIKKNVSTDILKRLCKNEFLTWGQVLDSKLNIVKEFKQYNENEIFDSLYNFYSVDYTFLGNKPFIVKKDIAEKILWKKEIDEKGKILSLLGADGKNNIYILMSGDLKILKINANGEILSNIGLPNINVFFSNNLRNGIIQLLCNGTIYYFPYYGRMVPKKSLKNNEEYSVYKFIKK